MTSKYKKSGSTFLIAVFLSVMILSLGLGAAQMVIKELNFSSDLLFGEQSYYAAESGVETILIDLKGNPVQHLTALADDQPFELGQSFFSLETNNHLSDGETFALDLAPLQSSRFRLLRDTDPTMKYSPAPAFDFDISIRPEAQPWQWKVLCQDHQKKTHALQNDPDVSDIADFLHSSQAEGFVAGGQTQDSFYPWINGMVPEACFFSVQNLSSETITAEITARGDGLAASVARIDSTGQAGNRQKRISFDYAQQNLGGLFDFVFFHFQEEE